MRNSIDTHGIYRIDQALEILADPKEKAPQEHIAEIWGVSKSTVSKWVKVHIRFKPYLETEAQTEYDLHLEYEVRRAVRIRDRAAHRTSRCKPLVLDIQDGTDRSA